MIETKKETIIQDGKIIEKMTWNSPIRPTWEAYALNLAKTAATRSQDPFVKVGACALRHDNSVAAVGYNGAPPHIDIDWSNRDERRIRVCHAEAACLRYVRPNECRLIAVTLSPCPACATLIASYGIPEVIYLQEYENDKEQMGLKLLNEFNIKVKKMEII